MFELMRENLLTKFFLNIQEREVNNLNEAINIHRKNQQCRPPPGK